MNGNTVVPVPIVRRVSIRGRHHASDSRVAWRSVIATWRPDVWRHFRCSGSELSEVSRVMARCRAALKTEISVGRTVTRTGQRTGWSADRRRQILAILHRAPHVYVHVYFMYHDTVIYMAFICYDLVAYLRFCTISWTVWLVGWSLTSLFSTNTAISDTILNSLTGLWIGFCLTRPISPCWDSFYVCVFCVSFYNTIRYNTLGPIFTWTQKLTIASLICHTEPWWGGPRGIVRLKPDP